jgi:hypothetical protein
MQVGSATNSSLNSLSSSLRLFTNKPFGDNPQVRDGSAGRFSITGGKLSFLHDNNASPREKNHFVTTKKPGNRFFAKVDVATRFNKLSSSTNSVGMVLKKQDDKNFLAINLDSKNQVRFLKYENGNRSVLKTATLKEDVGREFDMAVDVKGSKFTFYVNGEEVFTAKDSTFSGGEFGMGGFDIPANFENLEIYK